ncbi:TetR/AcrR family transcriptional regulator [Nocardia africana]|uniref:HTH-type transcriptional repressor KstR2 n=1 Tax=Nocardia africana TaxID=134964 RepID=A0A378WWR7_9NOCA|nr:TetR/AcrR family transcriptional regulator [Nocardia africana]MCC3313716.1 TetR/AcrR family transcriptional regulator [Nocardia africana]SUA44901.1 HTH-type transcriptional repressor KstR2 [Nocardia africana]
MTGSVDHAAETREEILRAAAQLFHERGYAKTKVTDIARAVGITPPSLYWHFASKEEILFEFLRTNLETFNREIAQAIGTVGDPESKLRLLATTHTRLQLQYRDEAQTVLSVTHAATQLSEHLSPEHTHEVRALNRAHIDRVRSIITEGVEQGVFATPDVTALTFAVVNICEYTAIWFRPERHLDPKAVADANGEFAVRMARNHHPLKE